MTDAPKGIPQGYAEAAADMGGPAALPGAPSGVADDAEFRNAYAVLREVRSGQSWSTSFHRELDEVVAFIDRCRIALTEARAEVARLREAALKLAAACYEDFRDGDCACRICGARDGDARAEPTHEPHCELVKFRECISALAPPAPAAARGAVLSMDTATHEYVARLERERDAWHETANLHCRNESYYRDLVVAIGKQLGDAAYIADDGSRSEDVLCAKVPELASQVIATLRGRMDAAERLVHHTLDHVETDENFSADEVRADLRAFLDGTRTFDESKREAERAESARTAGILDGVRWARDAIQRMWSDTPNKREATSIESYLQNSIGPGCSASGRLLDEEIARLSRAEGQS